MTDEILGALAKNQNIQTVLSDGMDERMFNDLKARSITIQAAEKAGKEVLRTFPPLTQDIWSSLFKFSPELRKQEEMPASHRLNSVLMEKMTQMQQYKELRVHTRLNDMHSAIATVTLASELTEKLKGEMKEQAEQANEIQSLEEEIKRASRCSPDIKGHGREKGRRPISAEI